MRATRVAMVVGFGLGIAGLAVAGVSPPSVDAPVSTGVRAPTTWGVVIYNSTDRLRGPLPSAKADGEAMAATLQYTLGVPKLSSELFAPGVSSTNRLVVLGERSAEQVREQLREVGRRAKSGEVVWVYAASHMTVAAGRDGSSGLVVVPPGAPQSFTADDSSVLRESELWSLPGAGGAEVRVVLDGCNTSRDAARVHTLPSSGAAGGLSYWRGALAGQSAHDMPGTSHGVATYFWLGGLRGWADGAPLTPTADWGEADGKVTADEQTRYVRLRVPAYAPVEQQVDYTFLGAAQKDAVLAVDVHERDPFRGGDDQHLCPDPLVDLAGWQSCLYGIYDEVVSAQAKVQAEATKDQAARAGVALPKAQAAQLFIGRWSEANVSVRGLSFPSPPKELIDAWVALGRPPDTGLAGYGDEVVRLPGGTFLMGRRPDKEGAGADYETLHLVTVAPFAMGQVELSRKLSDAALSTDPRHKGEASHWTVTAGEDAAKSAEYPVNNVSWCQVVRIANLLTRMDPSLGAGQEVYSGVEECEATKGQSVKRDRSKKGWRLPTEAEWEYSTRAGTREAWSGTGVESELPKYSNLDGKTDGYEGLAPVGSLRPNRWGLYDLGGNVWEWVEDGYVTYPLSGEAGPDSPPVPVGPDFYRAHRGGSFWFTPVDARAADRWWDAPGGARADLGVRLARSL